MAGLPDAYPMKSVDVAPGSDPFRGVTRVESQNDYKIITAATTSIAVGVPIKSTGGGLLHAVNVGIRAKGTGITSCIMTLYDNASAASGPNVIAKIDLLNPVSGNNLFDVMFTNGLWAKIDTVGGTLDADSLSVTFSLDL